MCRKLALLLVQFSRQTTFVLYYYFAIYFSCPISWDKAFWREFACPIIYNLPDRVELFPCENSWDMPSSATGSSEQEYKFGHVTYPITVKRFLCVTWRAKQDDAHIPLVHQHTRGRNSVTIDSIEGTHIYMYQLESFPRKNADRLKKDRTRPNRPATRCTAAVFYPAWRITGVHHKKGQPSTATSHEARPGKPLFASPASARAILVGVKQITRNYRASQALGITS